MILFKWESEDIMVILKRKNNTKAKAGIEIKEPCKKHINFHSVNLIGTTNHAHYLCEDCWNEFDFVM